MNLPSFLSTEAYTAIGMLAVYLLITYVLIKAKAIPLWWGKKIQGESEEGEFVTVKKMRINCEKRQSTLDKKLESIHAVTVQTRNKIDDLKETLSDHHARIAVLEERTR